MRRPLSACVVFALAAALLPLIACDEIAKEFGYAPTKAAQPTKREPATPIHRFVIMNFGADVGFDSQTGQICRTWDWQPLGKAAKPDAETGTAPQRKFGEFAPTCLSLYQQYPSVGNPSDSFGLLDKQQPNKKQ
jgi:hypothetical protein